VLNTEQGTTKKQKWKLGTLVTKREKDTYSQDDIILSLTENLSLPLCRLGTDF